ncbi:DUF6484 domain-containing protein [Vitiosangium sp. GDMCC 1.1324]|uniref:DUF6484 domain-containing protein n=1 Tax=Vitiosangium sp. (strain GDMCC 1.1324) TaxID=2138576 RepID=UPI001E3B67DD|nr:DUF6484 domain-containing protein [Vitiosangium sp. GDMCC 1.1324]
MDSDGNPRDKARLDVLDSSERILEPRIGWLLGMKDGCALVDYPANSRGPLAARLAVALEAQVLARAIADRQSVVLLFAEGDPAQPLVMGLLQAAGPSSMLEAVLDETLARKPQEVEVDGRRVLVEGREEVVLRCGKASLTLRRDGLVVLRGVNIRTEADELQRLRGGKVQIN